MYNKHAPSLLVLNLIHDGGMQVMVHVTEEDKRKVAVHCHAGLGRTG